MRAPDSEHADPERALAAAFEHLPHGALMGNADRRLHSANRVARDLLGTTLGAGDAECCTVFGCRASEGPLADACLTELALTTGAYLPEIRIDLPDDAPTDAAWVTAAAAGGDAVVFQVRAGARGDRRRRTDPYWLTHPELRIETFGKLRVSTGGVSVGGQWLEQRPGQILKYLVCQRGRIVPADELADAFWPERTATALNNLRHFVHVLRTRLEPARTPGAPATFVLARGGGYTLDRTWVQIDADEFERAADAGLAAARAGDGDTARAELGVAAGLYTADFISDEPYSDWILAERDRLHALAGAVLRELSDLEIAAGDLESAWDTTRRLADLLPYDMAAQRSAIEISLRRGRRTEAVRRYNALRARLRKQFGEAPDFELAELVR